MTKTARLSMVMIARNEQDNIYPCFDTFWDHVDEVVLCDTGSTDRTVAEAQRFAAEHNGTDKLVIGAFEWCDDFAAARNHANELASGDWLAWCDLDDRMFGAQSLRILAEAGPTEIVGYTMQWILGNALEGTIGPGPRLVRRGHGHWVYRCSEELRANGPCVIIPPDIAHFTHPHWENVDNPYYVTLWTQMVDSDDPEEAATGLRYIAQSHYSADRHEQAIEALNDYMAASANTDGPNTRACMLSMLINSMSLAGRSTQALTMAQSSSLNDSPSVCLAAADAAIRNSDWDSAAHWVGMAETNRHRLTTETWPFVLPRELDNHLFKVATTIGNHRIDP